MDYLLNTSDPVLHEDRLHASSSVPTVSSSNQMSLIAALFVGELVTSIFMETIHGRNVITYSTIYGSVCQLYPIETVQDVEALVALEAVMMGQGISLVGRVVDDFRSTFIPTLVCAWRESHL